MANWLASYNQRMNWKEKIQELLVILAVVFSSLNLFLKWQINSAYLNGIFSDYLIPKFWLAEIFVLVLIISFSVGQLHKIKIKLNLTSVLFLILFIFQFFTPKPLNSFLWLIKAFELIVFSVLIVKQSRLLNAFKYGVLFALILQIFIANLQFIYQSNLLPYRFLGESQLTNFINISRAQLAEKLQILPYGTTAHPNILAGLLAVGLVYVFETETKNNKQIKKPWLLLGLLAITCQTIFLTQAYGAIGVLVFYFVLKNWSFLYPKVGTKLFKLGTIIAILFSPLILVKLATEFPLLSLQRRIFLNAQAVLAWQNQPVFGTGLNSFLYAIKPQSSDEIARFIQPVHNVFLLWLAETGFLGIMFLVSLRKKIREWWNSHSLIAFSVLPLFLLDHYLLTQWLGGMIIVTIYLMPSDKNKNS
ncbi:MAG: hypothetical protein COU63_04245 [Candidatus Pacebacteria bacterium CG10_big_fil_rev_8_21_14_0_10_36_11]|nr:O-antigen ligase family protein [Candidatus Pacearchaeota archaeon]OIP74106.1 MAG: hypothetical protein AUK08_02520 [Candidatus Pacebacteria bacterium CG2_30_36_39]PIR64473.1 MAG: hypothetical protein COU63_04245 [Candidatus Pacebacteria bacterium CG10_big_fil_rev_8_21_14_0_10_36_11]PJC42706.1 MAG: hypothetical protein CO040_03020 [Candidatus Pacebacteria bacterium CG_4_9_14_0_2_um_filter_36_8]